MFKYQCPACDASAYSSASYATVGICPSCGSPLADGATETVAEPAPVSITARRDRNPSDGSGRSRRD
jgi:ribosomal protein L37AE/L43A